MKKLVLWPLSLLLLIVCAHAADNPPAQNPVKPLEQIAAEVERLLDKDKIYKRFDLLRRYQEGGLTWQPALLAPNNLVDQLDEQGLRFYAGVKLIDALYAATFMQKQAVAEAVQTIEAINDKLNLRSYADLSGSFFTTLKKAAAAPESVDLKPLIDQLTADYLKDIPPLMAHPKSAEYLIDSLYGATVASGYLLGQFYLSKLPELTAVFAKPDTGIGEWMRTLVELFTAAGRADETVQVEGKPVQKLAFVKESIANNRNAIAAGGMTPDALRKARLSVFTQLTAIRSAMLTPSVK